MIQQKIYNQIICTYISCGRPPTCKYSWSYFIYLNFDEKSCFVLFFHERNECKNPQFNFSSQNISIERNFFKGDGKEIKILHLLFHRIWKNSLLMNVFFIRQSIIYKE